MSDYSSSSLVMAPVNNQTVICLHIHYDINLISEPITRIRQNSFCMKSKQIQNNIININNENEDVIGLTIEEIQKHDNNENNENDNNSI